MSPTAAIEAATAKLDNSSQDHARSDVGRDAGAPSAAGQRRKRHPAIDNLIGCQRQLDMDGCEVAVSRQAIEETLQITEELLVALKDFVATAEEQVRRFHRLGKTAAELTMAIERALVAISKAEGRS